MTSSGKNGLKCRIENLHRGDIVKSTHDEYDITVEDKQVYIRTINTETAPSTSAIKENTDLIFKSGDAHLMEQQKEQLDLNLTRLLTKKYHLQSQKLFQNRKK